MFCLSVVSFFGEVPENLPVGMMTFLPSALAPHAFPASGCPAICLPRLPPPPPPPPPVLSALWCQCVCHTAVKANATQAPDHISASHEHPPTSSPPPHFLSSKLTRPGPGSIHLIGERRSIKAQDPKAIIWCFMIQESVR